ncbi:MAG: hypothetical protein GY722_12870 [bacterium]|nr:hypothetical protein [bacterium]
MAEKSSSLVSLLAALVVAVTGLIPVIWLLTSPAEQSVVEGEVAVESTTTISPEVAVVVDPVPELDVDELDPAVTRVLQANGYASFAGEPDLEGQLPDAVTRVLIDSGAVLTVVEDGPGIEEG